MSLMLLFFLLLFLSTTSATPIGITYNPTTPNLPPPEHIIPTLHSLRITTVHLLHPTPESIRAFAYSNITLLLTLPNHLVPPFAANTSAPSLWLHAHVLPFHPRTRISLISAGSYFITSTPVDPTSLLLPALRNLRKSLADLGITTIQVSTTFSFVDLLTTSFPPSSAEFQEPLGSLVVRPLLQFLSETNSSFLVDVYPYNVYRMDAEIPLGFALFEEGPFNFRDDVVTGVRYRNLFDMMADAIVAALAVSGQEGVPVVVAGTGWPGDGEGNYAETYLRGLARHLGSGLGTPLRKEGVAGAYVYQLFDEGGYVNGSDAGEGDAGQHWGIMYPNMTMKYKVDFSGGGGGGGKTTRWLLGTVVASLVTVECQSYHKTCFKCSHGGCSLSPSNYAALDGILYCKPHFSQLFKEKGSYNHLIKSASRKRAVAVPDS